MTYLTTADFNIEYKMFIILKLNRVGPMICCFIGVLISFRILYSMRWLCHTYDKGDP